MDKQTSDERLLKIIEGTSESRRVQGNASGPKKPLGKAPGLDFNLASFNLVSLKGLFKKLKINLAKINTALIGFGVFLTLIFIYTLFTAPVISKSNAAFFTLADSKALVKFISVGEAQGAMRKNFSLENLKRNFFLPANLKVSSIAAGETDDILEELKDFKLVGIIWSANPEVMIESSKDTRTYTLKKGESFNEQFKVKDILRNSAILEVNSDAGPREYELR